MMKSPDLLDQLKAPDLSPAATDAIHMVAALTGTVALALDSDEATLSVQDIANAREVVELASQLAWRALDAVEELERQTGRGFWGRAGHGAA